MPRLTPLIFTLTQHLHSVMINSNDSLESATELNTYNIKELTATTSCPAFPFLPTTDTCFTLLRASTIFADFNTCFSVPQYYFKCTHWAGRTWTRFVLSSERYHIFNLDLLDFKYCFTEFLKPCILSGFPTCSNSASRRSRNFWTASGFCASQSTILRSRIHGTKPLMASSQPFVPGQAQSIPPPPRLDSNLS
jgi:hypothetical protein